MPDAVPPPSDPDPLHDPARLEAETILHNMAQSAQLPSHPQISVPKVLLPDETSESANPAERARHWRTQQRYRALIEQIPVITFMAAIDETIHDLYISPQIEAVLGFTQSEWLDNPFLWYNQLHPDDRERWQKEFAQTCATGVHFKSEYRLLARDGRIVWIHGECQLIRDEQGHPLFLQGVAYDITETKRAEEAMHALHRDLETIVEHRTAELASANNALRNEILEHQQARLALATQATQLADSSRRKDEFLAILSHELRNPLSPLAMAAELLRNPNLKDEDRLWAQAVVERQVAAMSRLIDDLLDVSRISHGKITLRKSPVDLATVIRHAAEATRDRFTRERHTLILPQFAAPLWVHGDATRLEQILTNLLTNAAKYTPPGGQIIIAAASEAGHAVVRVKDNGVGIPTDMLERIFELFTQIDPSSSRASQWGLGIGLALVRELVELHAGTITAYSPGPGLGSEFTLRIPLSATHQPFSIPAAPAPRDVPRKILVVEDHPDSAAGLARLLKAWNHHVHIVHNGPEALAAAPTFRPEFILLDIGLPGMDGYQVAQKLRQDAACQNTYLLALTGYGRQEDREKAAAAGFNSHMTKPVNPDSLRTLLNSPHK